MTQTDGQLPSAAELAESLSDALKGTGLTIAVAESLTSGKIATALGAAPDSADWFAGGVVAYTAETKYTVLGVERGPVVRASAAQQMASGVARLTGADLAVAVTGAGGPEPQEDQPPGTVFIGLHTADAQQVEEHHFDGDVPEVLEDTVRHALRLLAAHAPAAVERQGTATS